LANRVGDEGRSFSVPRQQPFEILVVEANAATRNLGVEMEAAALFAVARFRSVKIGQILYGGDNLDSEAWDSRGWQRRWSIREKLVELAAEACLELTDED
jgi:purine-nucleoside phosphorylase